MFKSIKEISVKHGLYCYFLPIVNI